MGYAQGNPRLNPLTTDLYQLTMSQGFFNEGMATRESAYYLHWRTPAMETGTYSTVAGLEEAIDFLKNFRFSDDDIAYLASQERKGKRLFSDAFLNFLKDTPLQLDVEAMPEGEIQTTPGPVMRIKGPLYQCQMVESALLNIINRNSKIATRASLLQDAAGGAPIADFGLRRAPTLELGGPRSSYIGGCVAVADVDAGRALGIPVTGTMAHAWVMNFQQEDKPNTQTELLSFKKFLESMPHNSVLLVDTYHVEQGIDNAIRAAIETNTPLDGVRLDSGDLVDGVWYAAQRVEEAKQTHPDLFAATRVFVTDGLDELKILTFRKQLDQRSQAEKGVPFPNILAYGVGTELQNPGPLRGGVYKVSAHEVNAPAQPMPDLIEVMIGGIKRFMEPVMKLAGINLKHPHLPSSKASIPGVDLDVMRLWKDGRIVADIVVDTARGTDALLQSGQAISLHDNETMQPLPEHDKVEALLKPVFRRNAQGISEYVFDEPAKKTLYNGSQVTDLAAIRQFHLDRKAALPDAVRGVDYTQKPVVLIDPEIQAQRLAIIDKTNHELAASVPGTTISGGSAQGQGTGTPTRQI